jgi:hypothetical protein
MSAYVEATLAIHTVALAEPRIEAEILDAIDDLAPTELGLDVGTRGTLTQTPSISQIKRDVIRWLGEQDVDAVTASFRAADLKSLPQTELRYGDWRLRLRAIPIPGLREKGPSTRVIHIGPSRGGFIDNGRMLKDAVRAKAKRYGELDRPLIVAVNAIGDLIGRDDEMSALFGKEQFVVDLVNDEPVRSSVSRERDGAWVYGPEPRNTRVQAVMFFRGAYPSSAADVSVCTYLNPYVDVQIPGELLRFGVAQAGAGGKIEWHSGERLGEILGLPESWPGEDD